MGFGYSASSWGLSCNHPRTMSFRENGVKDRDPEYLVENPLWFDEEDPETSAVILVEDDEEEAMLESVVRGVRSASASSGRLFIEPAGHSSCILQKNWEGEEQYDRKGSNLVKKTEGEGQLAASPFKGGGVAVKVKSSDPYADFRSSMQEMIVAHGWMGWDWLQDMLEWYLQANGASGKSSVHSDTIVQAFVDMIMEQVFAIPTSNGVDSDCSSSSSNTSGSPVSPTTSSSSSSFS